jgi:transposase-like protein
VSEGEFQRIPEVSVKCPYCGHENIIVHTDGKPQDGTYICEKCGKAYAVKNGEVLKSDT